jgi:hypothetical protein
MKYVVTNGTGEFLDFDVWSGEYLWWCDADNATTCATHGIALAVICSLPKSERKGLKVVEVVS